MHLSHDEIAKRTGLQGEHFRFLYRLLSIQSHAAPLAFQAQSNTRGRGEENEAELLYIVLATQVVKDHICKAIIGMGRIFPKQLEYRFQNELAKVSEILRVSLLEDESQAVS